VRVLHVLHHSLPAVDGYAIRSDYIMRFQRQLGMEPAAVTSAQHANGEQLHEVVDAFPFWRTPALQGSPPTGLREAMLVQRLRARLETAIRAWRPDVLHAHSPMLVGIPAVHAARKFGLPVVYELRDLWENPSVDRGKFRAGSVRHRAAQAFENYVLRRADALVTVCRSLRDAVAPRAGRDARIFVVDNGVDVDRFSPRARNPELVARYGLQGKSVIVYLGTFQPYEGLELLVRAVPEIAAQVATAHLLVVGGGGEQPRLVELARSLGIEERVTFTGRVPHDQVVDVFPIGDLFVYPRLLTLTTALTTPLKPLEAMSMGRPVLVSDLPPMRELVAGLGAAGLFFKPGDRSDLVRAVVGALADRPALERLGRAGRELVVGERLWGKLVARYREVYAAAMERNRRRVGAPAA
jgi:PEP-CTERM/exosortase A-associated glycosyltransferase